MQSLRSVLVRLRALFHRKRLREELDEELRFHLEMETEHHRARGMPPPDARRAALLAFGGVERFREETRDARGGVMVDGLARDLRIAFRGFRRSPTFAVTAVLILGLAIGMTVAMITVFNAVLVQHLPVREQDRLVELWPFRDRGSELSVDVTVADAINRQSHTMREAASLAHYGAFAWPLADGDRAVVMAQTLVSGNFFEVLGAQPALGRLLRADDDIVGAGHVMVISYDAWRHQFGGDTTIVGHHLTYASTGWTYTIVGVAPPGLDYPGGVACWTALIPSGYKQVHVIARLAPGATPEAARAEFLPVAARLSPQSDYAGAEVRTLPQLVLGNVRPLLIVLTAAVALLLLIACVNVGNLLLLRAAERSRELAVRRALGATYGDLLRQLLVESGALALGGGVLGLACAQTLIRALVVLAPTQLPRADVISLSGAPIATTFVVACVSVLIFGVAPALFGARGNSLTSLRFSARSGSETRARSRVKRMMVASQVALTLMLLVGAALLARTLERLEQQNLGYATDHLSVLQLSLPWPKLQSTAKLFALYDELSPRLRAIPGVTASTPVIIPPFMGQTVWRWSFEAEGQSEREVAANPMVPVEMGWPEYFKTFGIPILGGRGFLDSDRVDAPLVVVVSQAVAHRFWPGENAIGKRIRVPGITSPSSGGDHRGEWRTVVGVAGDIRYRSLRDATPTVYVPGHQAMIQNFLAVRTTTDLAAVLPAMRRAVSAVEPDASIWRAQTMDDLLAGPLAQPRLGAVLMSGFGIASLLLASIGLYGVMASTVRERTRDIGVRMALGATPQRVRRDVLNQAIQTFGVGALVGLVGALAMSRLLTTLLFDVSPADPIAFVSAGGLLFVVALAAAYIPARRATRIDPAQALRSE